MKRKKFCLVKMKYCEFFLKIRYSIWRYAELNRLLAGSGQIPLNIDLKQDDYTACCSHTVVEGDEAIYSCLALEAPFVFYVEHNLD